VLGEEEMKQVLTFWCWKREAGLARLVTNMMTVIGLEISTPQLDLTRRYNASHPRNSSLPSGSDLSAFVPKSYLDGHHLISRFTSRPPSHPRAEAMDGHHPMPL
jgi:hypothetical protein